MQVWVRTWWCGGVRGEAEMLIATGQWACIFSWVVVFTAPHAGAEIRWVRISWVAWASNRVLYTTGGKALF